MSPQIFIKTSEKSYFWALQNHKTIINPPKIWVLLKIFELRTDQTCEFVKSICDIRGSIWFVIKNVKVMSWRTTKGMKRDIDYITRFDMIFMWEWQKELEEKTWNKKLAVFIAFVKYHGNNAKYFFSTWELFLKPPTAIAIYRSNFFFSNALGLIKLEKCLLSYFQSSGVVRSPDIQIKKKLFTASLH